jgi:hypothetical protein
MNFVIYYVALVLGQVYSESSLPNPLAQIVEKNVVEQANPAERDVAIAGNVSSAVKPMNSTPLANPPARVTLKQEPLPVSKNLSRFTNNAPVNRIGLNRYSSFRNPFEETGPIIVNGYPRMRNRFRGGRPEFADRIIIDYPMMRNRFVETRPSFGNRFRFEGPLMVNRPGVGFRPYNNLNNIHPMPIFGARSRFGNNYSTISTIRSERERAAYIRRIRMIRLANMRAELARRNRLMTRMFGHSHADHHPKYNPIFRNRLDARQRAANSRRIAMIRNGFYGGNRRMIQNSFGYSPRIYGEPFVPRSTYGRYDRIIRNGYETRKMSPVILNSFLARNRDIGPWDVTRINRQLPIKPMVKFRGEGVRDMSIYSPTREMSYF